VSMKNLLTPAGIEPATFQFVAQHLNHCATLCPLAKLHAFLRIAVVQNTIYKIKHVAV